MSLKNKIKKADLNFYDKFYDLAIKEYEEILLENPNIELIKLRLETSKILTDFEDKKTMEEYSEYVLTILSSDYIGGIKQGEINEFVDSILEIFRAFAKDFLKRRPMKSITHKETELIDPYISLLDKIYDKNLNISEQYLVEISKAILNLSYFMLNLIDYQPIHGNDWIPKVFRAQRKRYKKYRNKYKKILKENSIDFEVHEDKTMNENLILSVIKYLLIVSIMLMVLFNTNRYYWLIYWGIIFFLTTPELYRIVLPYNVIKLWERPVLFNIKLRTIILFILFFIGFEFTLEAEEINFNFFGSKFN